MNKSQPEFELSAEFLEHFREAMNTQQVEFIRSALADVEAADIAALLFEFSSAEMTTILEQLDVETRAMVINEMDSDLRLEYMTNLPAQDQATLLNHLASDDVADIVNELPLRNREEVLDWLEPEYRTQVVELLRYEPHVAGGLMAKELIRAKVDWTVVQCIEEIRVQAENVSKFYQVWVVDEQDKLIGKVALQDLIISDARKTVGEICERDVVSVDTFMEDTEVADIMKKYDMESVPVVNHTGQLVGRITIDDVVDVITEQAEEERQIMAGISEDVEADDSVWHNARARLPWLLIGVLGGLLNAKFMGLFEAELARITAIAFFTPLIQATGGNVGIQSSSLIVQSLARVEIVTEGLLRKLVKVFLVALLNGVLLAVLVFAANVLIFHETHLSLVVSLALFSVVVFASFVGTLTPLLLNRLGFNPALAAGPFITTINDLLGLTVYFLTIRMLL